MQDGSVSKMMKTEESQFLDNNSIMKTGANSTKKKINASTERKTYKRK